MGISAYLGALGVSRETVYFAFEEVLKPKKTDTLIISGAAGYDSLLFIKRPSH